MKRPSPSSATSSRTLRAPTSVRLSPSLFFLQPHLSTSPWSTLANLLPGRCEHLFLLPASLFLTAIQIVTPNNLHKDKCPVSRSLRFPKAPPPASVARYNDVFRQLDLDPVDFALAPNILSAFTSEMGKIYARNVTGLTAHSQRRLGKAIRRSRAIGILPQLSRPSKLWVPNSYRRRKITM